MALPLEGALSPINCRVSDGRRSERRKWWSLHVPALQTGITFEKGSISALYNKSRKGEWKRSRPEEGEKRG